MRSLWLIIGCCLAFGCGIQENAWEEDPLGKAEDFTNPEKKPEILHQGYPLTLGQEDTFIIQKTETQVFYVEVPPGLHGYKLSLQWVDLPFFSKVVQAQIGLIPESGPSNDFGVAVTKLKQALDYCAPSEIDCISDEAYFTDRFMGMHEGPGRLALAVRLVDGSDVEYNIKIEEMDIAQPGDEAYLMIGWTDPKGVGTSGASLFEDLVSLPEPGVIPFMGDVIIPQEQVALYKNSFQTRGLIDNYSRPWESAFRVVPPQTKLRMIKESCEAMSLNVGRLDEVPAAEHSLVGCWVKVQGEEEGEADTSQP